jgi:thiol:disulfide interchange protein
MGFPMLATAMWLFSLIPLHYGRRSLWLGLFLVILALAAWIYGEFVQRGRARVGWPGGLSSMCSSTPWKASCVGARRSRHPRRSQRESRRSTGSAGVRSWPRPHQGRPIFVDLPPTGA